MLASGALFLLLDVMDKRVSAMDEARLPERRYCDRRSLRCLGGFNKGAEEHRHSLDTQGS